jgi:hypothetical protein
MPKRRPLIRDFHAGQYLDIFLVSAVTAVLGIRFYLWVMDYPKVGGEALHIAHMLWGGLLMLASIVVVLSFLGRRGHQFAALLGGLGFGTFIDEIGKFVTHDNDYFYRPAIALIYVSFVLTYLAVRSIHGERLATPEEYLVNALQEMENVVLDNLDQVERDRALSYLERADPADPLVVALKDVLNRTELVPVADPPLLVRLRDRAAGFYHRATRWEGFAPALVAFFGVQLVLKLLQVLAMLFWETLDVAIFAELPPLDRLAEGLSLIDWLQFGSSLLSGLFVLLGVVWLRHSRLQALRMFQRSILVSIFLTQVFMFYHHQWNALVMLAINLLILPPLNFMIERERGRGSPAAV